MRKTIICLIAPSNKGKTTAIKKVYELLGGDGEVRNNNDDFVDVLKCDGAVVGCGSAGDPPGVKQKDALEYLMGQEICDIVIGASRTRGITVDNVLEFAKMYKYRIIWFTPSYVYDPLNDEVYDFFTQKNAEIVIKLVRQIINGII